eukprot:scaffold203443_cov28-Tisochrysis_lutea.AAC.1
MVVESLRLHSTLNVGRNYIKLSTNDQRKASARAPRSWAWARVVHSLFLEVEVHEGHPREAGVPRGDAKGAVLRGDPICPLPRLASGANRPAKL